MIGLLIAVCRYISTLLSVLDSQFTWVGYFVLSVWMTVFVSHHWRPFWARKNIQVWNNTTQNKHFHEVFVQTTSKWMTYCHFRSITVYLIHYCQLNLFLIPDDFSNKWMLVMTVKMTTHLWSLTAPEDPDFPAECLQSHQVCFRGV